MTFWKWLLAQRNRNDRIGDIARDAAVDREAPHHATSFLYYLRTHPRACDGAKESAEVAVREWREQRQFEVRR